MKQPRILSRQILAVVALIGCTLAILLILQIHHPPKNDPRTTTPGATHQQATVKPPKVNDYGLPIRLKIPKINVDVAVEQMGLTSEGDMQAPSNPQTVGWYKFGPHPGNKGSAVVAGHYGLSSEDTSTVFNKLHTLSEGDLVRVEDEKGVIITFKVRELKTYNKDTATPEVFSSSDEKAHLNLVTCKGTWRKDQQTYSDRLVVFADN